MKYVSLVILLGISVAHLSGAVKESLAHDDKQVSRQKDSGYSSMATWYDQADEMIEELTRVSSAFYSDAAVYQSWTNRLNEISDQLNAREQHLIDSFDRVQSEVGSLRQRIKGLEAQHHDDVLVARQEQFDIDGQKVGELINAIEQVKSGFQNQIVPQREALFSQLEIFISFLRSYMERTTQRAENAVQRLQDDNSMSAGDSSGEVVPSRA